MNTIQNLIQEVILERLRGSGESVEVITPDLTDNYSPKSRQIILSPSGTERETANDCQGNPPAVGWRSEWTVRAIIMQDYDDGQTSIDEPLSELTSKAYNSITSPPQWWQFGGYALNAEVTGVERVLDESIAAYQITFNVYYRTYENDIFTRR